MEVEMKKIVVVLISLLVLMFCVSLPSFAGQNIPKKKQTVLGLYVTAKDAYKKWTHNPGKFIILDVRTSAEYAFVGHPPMAHHIPYRILVNKLNKKKTFFSMPVNKKFVADVKRKFKFNDTLFVICRSGGRSAAAVNVLAKAGFKNAYSVLDGFEGDKLKVPGSYFKGKRVVNGWKNSGAPWTNKIDKKLVYAK